MAAVANVRVSINSPMPTVHTDSTVQFQVGFAWINNQQEKMAHDSAACTIHGTPPANQKNFPENSAPRKVKRKYWERKKKKINRNRNKK